MDITLQKSTTFKKVIEAIKELCKETNIEFTEEGGMQIQAMDSSHVSLVSLTMKQTFDTLKCEKATNIALNLENLAKILRVCDADSALNLKLVDKESKLRLHSSSDQKITKFDLNLMDIEMDRVDIPDMNYPVKIGMHCSEFTRICRDMKEFGDELTIGVNDDSVDFTVRGDFATGGINLKPSSSVTIDFGCNLEQSYTLRYLLAFTKAAPLADNVVLELGEEAPLKVSFAFSESDNLAFYLAPKIDLTE